MFKNIVTNKYMYPILDYDNYAISRDGFVGKSYRLPGDPLNEFQKYDDVPIEIIGGCPHVRLVNDNGEKLFLIAKLNLNSIFGDLPFDIIYRDNNPMNVCKDNLYYKFADYTIQDGIDIDGKHYNGKILILYGSNKHKTFVVFHVVPNWYVYNNERFWISMEGAIYDKLRNVLISRSCDNKGYYKIRIASESRYENGKLIKGDSVYLRLHQAVYATWVNNEGIGRTVDHLDGRRHNCNLSNLEAVSLLDNIRRQHAKNTENPLIIRSRWTEDQAREVCKRLEKRETFSQIAEALGIDSSDKNTKDYVSVRNLCKAIIDRRTFAYLSKDYDIPRTDQQHKYHSDYKTPLKYNTELVKKACLKFVEGKLPTQVSREIPELPLGTLEAIRQGRSYKEIALTVPGMDKVIETRVRKVDPNSFFNKTQWTEKDIRFICEMIQDGCTKSEICEILGYGKNPSAKEVKSISNLVKSLITGRTHKDIISDYDFSNIPDNFNFPFANQFTKEYNM